jgi:hypothetical protein
MRNLLLASMLLLSGCTFAFGAGGAMSADAANAEARKHGKPETASSQNRAVVGGLIGLVLDVTVVAGAVHSMDGLSHASPSFNF